MACLIANRKYGKNGGRGREDPSLHCELSTRKDAVENGLTMEKAQALGLQFCKGQLPRSSRHRRRTHPDGHNSAGEYPRPHRRRQLACPHRGTAALHGQAVRLGKRARSTAAPLPCPAPPCRSHGDVRASRPEPDQPAGSPRRPCFEREYWAQRRGQRRLDHANAKLAAEGQQPTQTVYQTELDKAAKSRSRCAEQDHHLRGIFCIAHAGTRHRP